MDSVFIISFLLAEAGTNINAGMKVAFFLPSGASYFVYITAGQALK